MDGVTDQELVLHCEALLKGAWITNDGEERVFKLHVQKEDCAMFDSMIHRRGNVSIPVTIGLVELGDMGGNVNQLHANQTELQADPNPEPVPLTKAAARKSTYGQQARELKLHTFFRTKKVWKEIASDNNYQAWCRTQKCAFTKTFGTENDPIQAAHVRRVADGSGTSIKNDYATIPLLASVHRKQHNEGESAVGGSEWFDKQRIYHVTKWAWHTLKARLGFDSWAEVPPLDLCEWAMDHGVYDELPKVYKNALELEKETKSIENA